MAAIHSIKRGRRFKYQKWMRETVVHNVLALELTIQSQADEYGIPHSTIRYWIDEALKKQNAPTVTAAEADLTTDGSVSKLYTDNSTNEPSAQGGTNPQTQEG
jgi:hypothetical protein